MKPTSKSIIQENLYTTALNCLYYGECGGMLDAAKRMTKQTYDKLMKDCIRLNRFVGSLELVTITD
jgi:hypothetical protein